MKFSHKNIASHHTKKILVKNIRMSTIVLQSGSDSTLKCVAAHVYFAAASAVEVIGRVGKLHAPAYLQAWLIA